MVQGKLENKVSILIPLYNSRKYICETIESCLSQSYKNKEIIIVDDGSDDGSYELAKQYESDILKVYRQENSGACRARNKAFELSTGDYIQYMDADDLLPIDKIEKQMVFFEKYGDDIVVNCSIVRFSESYERVYNSKKVSFYKNYLDSPLFLNDMWRSKYSMQTSVWLVPRRIIEKVGGWNEDIKKNQDGEFFSRIVLYSKSVFHAKDTNIYYRVTPNSISLSLNYDSTASLLYSLKCYERNIKSFIDTYPTLKEAFFCQLTIYYLTTYSLFPDLAENAKLFLNKMGGRFVIPSDYPMKYQLLLRFLGVELVAKIRAYFKN